MAAAIAESLLHFIWQGTALGVLAYLILRRVGDHPAARYAVGLGTLAAMALAPVLTTFWLLSDDGALVVGLPGAVAATGSALPVAWVLGLWASGVTMCAIRLTGGWVVARGMATKAGAPVSQDIAALASRIAARLSVTTPFVVVESAVAASPMMVGWLKPVILLPSAAIAGLPPAHLEALLAHELGHIRRHDYIVNLMQSVVETLLFFHPAVWLISREVREAREQCCDDLTVSVCDRLVYVSALSSVAGLRAASPALAAGGGSLRHRVQRILHPQPAASPSVAWLAVAPIALVLAAALPVTGAPESIAAPRTAPAAATAVAAPEPAPAPLDAPVVVRASLPPAPETPLAARPQPEPAQTVIRPALPVVLTYFAVPTQAMELQAPPPPQAESVPRAAVGYRADVLSVAASFATDDLPRVSVQDQVFFVNGHVNSPGMKVWEPGMTVSQAVALADGLTSKGKYGHIERPVKDKDGTTIRYVRIKALKPETKILPDDQLVIARKWID